MGILSGNPKDEPLHYGEVYGVWQFSMKAKCCLSGYRAYQNHAGDKDLKSVLRDLIDQTELEIKECDAILTTNGIAPAPALPDRPEVEFKDIPVGARFADPEISSIIASEIAVGLIACSQIMGSSIREDVGALFAKYHAAKTALGLRSLRLSKEKGWLIPPPLQIQRPDLVEA